MLQHRSVYIVHRMLQHKDQMRQQNDRMIQHLDQHRARMYSITIDDTMVHNTECITFVFYKAIVMGTQRHIEFGAAQSLEPRAFGSGASESELLLDDGFLLRCFVCFLFKAAAAAALARAVRFMWRAKSRRCSAPVSRSWSSITWSFSSLCMRAHRSA